MDAPYILKKYTRPLEASLLRRAFFLAWQHSGGREAEAMAEASAVHSSFLDLVSLRGVHPVW